MGEAKWLSPGVVESVEICAGGYHRRWRLRKVEVLLSSQWEWVHELEGTRLHFAEAERLITVDGRAELPDLPTEPPQVPMFLRVCYGAEVPLPVRRPDPAHSTGSGSEAVVRAVAPVADAVVDPSLAPAVRAVEAAVAAVRPKRLPKGNRVDRIYSQIDAEGRWEAQHEQ